MKLIQPKIRHLKFTMNDAIKNQYPLTENLNLKYDAGTEENYTRFGIRWTITYSNKNGLEAITQITESRSIFKLEEAKKDLADLKAFIHKAFESIQTNFQDKLPLNLKHIAITEPNFDEMAETLMVEILKVK